MIVWRNEKKALKNKKIYCTLYTLLDYVGYIKTKTLFIGGAIMQSDELENLQELYSSYASDDELVMTEDIKQVLDEQSKEIWKEIEKQLSEEFAKEFVNYFPEILKEAFK